MRLTQVLNSPPIFRFWKHFGAGLQRRQPNFKHWRHGRIAHFERRHVPDHTLPPDKLPPGATVLEADDLMKGHIDEMPDTLLKRKANIPVLFDHPWPYNVQLDPTPDQTPIHCYNIDSRFFKPVEDCQILTNSLIETDCLEAHPPLEPSGEHMQIIRRQIEWATKGDSVMIRLPKDRSPEWPKMNRRPRREYGVTKERKEVNVMNALTSYAQTLLAKFYHEQANKKKLNEILGQRSLMFPHCVVPFERGQESSRLHMDLFIDSMTLARKSLPQIESKPDGTREREPIDIRPRTWRSLLEKSRNYSPSYSFTLPRDSHLHTIQLASRIKRKHWRENEMLARLVVHAFGVSSQFARFREVATESEHLASNTATNNQASCVLQEPLALRQVNQRNLLEQPIVLQSIGYDHYRGEFLFLRYQLNTLNFDDQNSARVKNQVWHSGPISDLEQALRYYLDFQSFDASQVDRLWSDILAARRAKLEAAQKDDGPKSTMAPERLADGY